MTNFLIKRFLGKNADPHDPKTRGKFAKLAGFTGIFANLLLFACKLTLGILSASVAMIADAFNNVSDAGSAIVTLIGFRLSEKHVDKQHPWGHGRLEYVSGFLVDMLIILVGFELLTTSIEHIFRPTLPSVGNVTLFLLGASILVKVWLFFFYKKIGTAIDSAAIRASATDSLTDCIATALVLISALVARFYSVAIDGWAGVFVAVFILFTGIKAAKETIDLLLGTPPDPAFIQEIYDSAKAYGSVKGIHDVMVHDYGPGRKIVSFHAEVPSDSDINVAHEEIDKMECDLHERFGCIVTVHLDPIVTDDPLVNELRTLAESAVKEVNETFSIHDFRITKGETRINLIFDLLLPVDSRPSEQEAESAVAAKIREKRPDCHCVIHSEHPFI